MVCPPCGQRGGFWAGGDRVLTVSWASEFARWFLAAFFVVVALVYTFKILAARRRTGRSPVALGTRGTEARRIYTTFRIFRVLILLVCLGRLAWPGLDRLLVPIGPLWSGPLMLTGCGLLLLSFALVLAIHRHMAADWRSGIEAADAGGRLLTDGPFALSRNPIAILVQLGQLGLFLALPTVFTLICLAIGTIAIHRHVRLEEIELARRHGPAYGAYRALVSRWLALGRLTPAASWRTRSTARGRVGRSDRPGDPGPRPG